MEVGERYFERSSPLDFHRARLRVATAANKAGKRSGKVFRTAAVRNAQGDVLGVYVWRVK